MPGRRGEGDPSGDARLPRPRRLPDADVQRGHGDQDGDTVLVSGFAEGKLRRFDHIFRHP